MTTIPKRAVFFISIFVLLFCNGCPDNSSSTTTGVCGDANNMISSTFSGTILYEDQPFDSNGFTGTTSNKAIQYADVQVVSDCTSKTLGSSNTDSSGNYSFSISVPSGEEAYVRVLTSTDSSSKNIKVKDSTSGDSLYSIISNNVTVTGDISKNLTATVTSGSAEPFNVFMVLMDSALFVESITGAPITNTVTGYFSTSTTAGTYFDGTNLFIFICGGCSNDDDGWDDTVIMHEFGHYVANVYSKDSSPGGQHSLTGAYEITLTWSEGWATFFATATRDYLGLSSPEMYIDTDALDSSNILIRYEIESPLGTFFGSGQILGSENEVAVASVLWDIYDTYSDSGGFDTIASGIGTSASGIWGVFSSYLNSASSVSIEDFWDGWFSKGYGTIGGTNDITNIFQDRKIYFVADTHESNNTSATATALTLGTAITSGTPATNLTFYPAGDVDWFSFSYTAGSNYTITTQDDGDRADPLIETYIDPAGSSICRNDDISNLNRNAQITIVGSTTCNSTTTGTMYIKVFSSTNSSNPATYGNYNIKVTQN